MLGIGTFLRSLCYNALVNLPNPSGYQRLKPLAPDYEEYRRLRIMVIMSRRYRYFYMVNPKVASTSIRNRLHELNGYAALEDPREVMGHKKSGFLLLKDLRPREFMKIANGPEYFKFSFVRNPFDRLVSGYVYFQRELKENIARGEYPKKLLFCRKNDPRRDPKTRKFMDFETYINDVCRNQSGPQDQHFLPQSQILKTDLINYDFIGRLENFTHDLNHVLDSLGAPSEIKERAGQRTNATKKIKPANEWFTPELADMVRERFMVDFETFGYDYAVPG